MLLACLSLDSQPHSLPTHSLHSTVIYQIEHKGVTYSWEDFCSSNGGFPYEFPCARLSPMDLFQESRWYFNYQGAESTPVNTSNPAPKQDLYRRTWYKELIQAKLVNPRIPRFGVMTNLCPTQCQDVLGFRLFPPSPGYSPFSLFADIGNLVRYS